MTPAAMPFARHRTTVITGLVCIIMVLIGSEPVRTPMMTITPNTAPRNPPTIGPYNSAPMMIGIKERVGVKGPILMPLATVCRTTITAVSKAVVTSFLVFLFLIKKPPLSFPWYALHDPYRDMTTFPSLFYSFFVPGATAKTKEEC